MIFNETSQEQRLSLIEKIRSETVASDDWLAQQILDFLDRLEPDARKPIDSILNLAVGNGGLSFCQSRCALNFVPASYPGPLTPIRQNFTQASG